MEQILGASIQMNEGIEDQPSTSTLGTSEHNTTYDDGTATQEDKNTRDYAAGYVVIIDRLMKLGRKVDNSYSVMMDVKTMIIDLAHSVSRLNDTVATLQSENTHLKFKLQEVSEK